MDTGNVAALPIVGVIVTISTNVPAGTVVCAAGMHPQKGMVCGAGMPTAPSVMVPPSVVPPFHCVAQVLLVKRSYLIRLAPLAAWLFCPAGFNPLSTLTV